MKKALSLILVFIASLALVACGGGNKAKLAEAKEALDFLDVNLNQVTKNFELYTEGLHGTTITWESSNSEVGFVRVMEDQTVLVADRPTADKGNVTLTLTATLKLGKEVDTKEFGVTVVALSADVVNVENIAKIRERDDKGALILKGKEVRLQNVVVANTDSDAYYISDGTTVLLVFGSPAGVLVGDKGTIVASVDDYYNSAQLANASFVAKGEGTVAAKDVNLRDYWLAETATDAEMKAAYQNPANLQLIKFEALVLKRVDFTGGASYQLTLVGQNAEGKYDINENFVLSYYKGLLDDSGKGEIHDLNGKIVTVTATIRELRTNRVTTAGKSQPVWSLSIKEVVSSKDPSTEVQTVVDSFVTIKQDFPAAGTLTLPTKGAVFGSTLSWTLKDETQSTLIDIATGKVTPVTGERKEVVIVVTSTKDGKTATYEYLIFVGDYVDVTIAEFKERADNTAQLRITGTITASKAGPDLYTIQDKTGAVTIYSKDTKFTKDFGTGKKVSVAGVYGVHNGLIQLINVVQVKDAGKADEYATVKLTDATNLADYQGQLVELTGEAEAKVSVDSYKNITLKLVVGTETIVVKFDTRSSAISNELKAALEALNGGEELSVVGAVLVDKNGAWLSLSAISSITLK